MDMSSEPDGPSRVYEPTYRQQDVDYTLEDHENRLSRLEKAGLIALGYGIAEGAGLVTDLVQLL